MHKHVPVITAAVLAVSSLAIGQAQQQEQPQAAQDQQAHMAGAQMGGAQELQRQIPSQAANVKEDTSSKREVQKVIATVTEAAITEGRFDQLKQSFSKSDRDRMQQGGQQAGQQQPGQMGQQPGQMAGQQPGQAGQQPGQQGSQDLDTAIREMRQAYRQKFDKDLTINEAQILPERVTVVSGEVTNPQMLTTWPLRATQAGAAGQADSGIDAMAQPAAGGIGQQPQTPGQASQHGGLKQGDKIAAVRFPGEQQMPELTISLVQSENQWQLDLPNTVDSNKIRQNLAKHIRHLTQNVDKLPQDASKASQQISHHVLMALYNVDLQQAGAAQPAAGGM